MKTLKKISVLLIIIIILSFIHVNAADNNIFSLTDASGYKDDEVTIILKLDKELEFASADISLKYDSSKLEYVKYTGLDILNKAAMNLVKDNPDTGIVAIGYVSNPDSASLNKTPGQVLSVTFKIKSSEAETLDVLMSCRTLKNDAGDSIEVADAHSKITVLTKSSEGGNNPGTSNEINGNVNENIGGNTNNIVKNESTVIINPSKGEATSPLPQTGNNDAFIIIPIIVLVIINYYFYKKDNDLKNI